MSENWRFQLSVKVEGQHLLNLRADDAVGFGDALKWATENKEPILIACAALGGSQKPQPSAPAQTPRQVSNVPQKAATGEIGPVSIDAITVSDVDKNGNRMDSSRFAVKFSDGKTYSTFAASVGESAQTLKSMGKKVFYTTVPGKNPKFTNLDTLRMAE